MNRIHVFTTCLLLLTSCCFAQTESAPRNATMPKEFGKPVNGNVMGNRLYFFDGLTPVRQSSAEIWRIILPRPPVSDSRPLSQRIDKETYEYYKLDSHGQFIWMY